MTTTTKALFQAKFAETSETLQYTSENCKTIIDKLTATNRSLSNQTLIWHIVPFGGAAGESNAITVVIAPGKTYTFPELVGHIMEAGDYLSCIAAAVSTIWIRGSGRQITA